ncbi:MAG: hypothetical protein J5621_08140 [Paludibacteraceae bacterium]|nr:hypothetical protein [Paludibacteraceae bacterium]
MRDTNLKWYFAQSKNGGGTGVNDGLTDLFSGGTLQDLVRESIQNSLDAKAKEEPYVRVEYTLQSFSTADFPNFLGLKSHIEACDKRYPNSKYHQMLESVKSPVMQVLNVADYHTIGMDFYYDEEGNEKGRFSKFVRFSGDPNSDQGAGGSHGYGKITYFKMSSIKTIFVSSMNRADTKCTFQGVARLATHPTGIPQIAFSNLGFFDEGEGDPMQETPVFINDHYNYSKIPQDFQRQEPGTTTSILFAAISDKKKAFKECCEAVLRSFFVAIEAGILEVYINLGEGYEIVINQGNIEKIFKERFFMNPTDSVRNNPFEKLNPHPYWLTYKNLKNQEATVAPGTSVKDAAQQCNGKQYVLIKEHLPILGDVAFYVYVSPEGNDLVLFMRRPKMLVNLHQLGRQMRRGFSAIFICEDPQGNELLRKMENAAHNKWDAGQLINENRPDEEIALAGKISDEMEGFINRCLDDILFPSDDSDSVPVDLSEFSMQAMNLDGIVNPYLGSLVSIKGQDENNIGAPVDLIIRDTQTGSPRVSFGQAHSILHRKAKKSKEEQKYTAGASKKVKTEGGGSSTSGRDSYTDSDENKEKLVRQALRLNSYRIIAGKNATGMDEYLLIVNSPVDVERAYLTLTPVGETADKESGIQLVSVSAGKIKGNEISGVPLHEGRNEFVFSISEAGEFTFSLKAEHEFYKSK